MKIKRKSREINIQRSIGKRLYDKKNRKMKIVQQD